MKLTASDIKDKKRNMGFTQPPTSISKTASVGTKALEFLYSENIAILVTGLERGETR
jgi:hypothetical protein